MNEMNIPKIIWRVFYKIIINKPVKNYENPNKKTKKPTDSTFLQKMKRINSVSVFYTHSVCLIQSK